MPGWTRRIALSSALFLVPAVVVVAQEPGPGGAAVSVTCSSTGTQRQHCPADTSKGVILARSTGEAPCLLGKTWGYDDKGVWVAEGCSAVFIVGPQTPVAPEAEKKKPLQHIPNIGFLLVATPETTQIAADVINRYPDRFLFGTDEVAPAEQTKYLKVYDLYAPLFAKLQPEVRDKLLKGNHERLFDEARRKVRAWERANAK